VPLAERMVRVAEELVGDVLGARLAAGSQHEARRIQPPTGNFGRDRTVMELRRLLTEAVDTSLLVCGRDGVELLAAALQAQLVAVAAAYVRSDAAAVAAILEAQLAGGRVCVTVSEEPAPEERSAVASALDSRAAGLLIWAPNRDGLLWLDALGAAIVEVPRRRWRSGESGGGDT
jgi:hypothetical protein